MLLEFCLRRELGCLGRSHSSRHQDLQTRWHVFEPLRVSRPHMPLCTNLDLNSREWSSVDCFLSGTVFFFSIDIQTQTLTLTQRGKPQPCSFRYLLAAQPDHDPCLGCLKNTLDRQWLATHLNTGEIKCPNQSTSGSPPKFPLAWCIEKRLSSSRTLKPNKSLQAFFCFFKPC